MADKLLILFALVCLFSTESYPQIEAATTNNATANSTVQMDTRYFIVGSLRDYMGRYAYVNRNDQVDTYFPYEKSLQLYIAQLVQQELKSTIAILGSETFSKAFATQINAFYDKNGLLIDSLFSTHEQMCSFLTGLYYRNGTKLTDSIYKIQVANSPNHETCYKLLKKIGCNKIFFKHTAGFSGQYCFYFEPTLLLRQYFQKLAVQKQVLDLAYYQTIKPLFKNDPNIEEAFFTITQEEAIQMRLMFK